MNHFLPSGPDAHQYLKMAENLKSGIGLVDNLRFDEIIPPIGHPLILMIFGPLLWSYFALIIYLTLIIATNHFVFKNIFY